MKTTLSIVDKNDQKANFRDQIKVIIYLKTQKEVEF